MVLAIDVDVGAPGEPHRPVREAFERRGLRISDGTIAGLRSGGTDPTRTAYRLACVDKLRANDAALETHYCLHVLQVGREHRRAGREPPRVYACFGLTRAREAALGCTHLELSCVLRAMRADLALWSTSNWDDQLVGELREAASLFLRVRGDRSWWGLRSSNDVINTAWDKQTIHGFYFALYSVAGSLSRGAWLPYELDLMRSFYVRQHGLGDPLTPLDRQILAGVVNLSPTARELARMVRAHVGVGYDERCVTMHRHLLVRGSLRAAVRALAPCATRMLFTFDRPIKGEQMQRKRRPGPGGFRGPQPPDLGLGVGLRVATEDHADIYSDLLVARLHGLLGEPEQVQHYPLGSRLVGEDDHARGLGLIAHDRASPHDPESLGREPLRGPVRELPPACDGRDLDAARLPGQAGIGHSLLDRSTDLVPLGKEKGGAANPLKRCGQLVVEE